MKQYLLTGVTPFDSQTPVDLLLKDGIIAARGIALAAPDGATTIDCRGLQLFPGFVDAHAHLDKTLLGRDWYINDVPRSLGAMIENERHYRKQQQPDAQVQSERIARGGIASGTSFIRTHVDIDNEIGLANLEGVLETRRKLAGYVDIEIVAFPQSGILQNPGTEALLDQALAMGAELIGGLDPCSFDRDPRKHLDIIFELACRHNKKIDIHLHERGELGAFSLELILDYTRRYQKQNGVTLSHGFCLGMVEASQQQYFAEQMAELGVSVATTAPSDIAVPPWECLDNAGVAICAGNDGVRDTWSPYGNGDMLQRAVTMGLRYRWRKDSEILRAAKTITEGGARVMGLKNYGLEVGCRADLVLVPGRSMVESLVELPTARTVFKRGVLIAENGECLF
ncbi:amidohydrolase family protein [Klebsiella sp. BIGb0407]|uniref:amidohydrolase family protein n=1 Tax=Klebsiella sp. BIGb0407 TaxID=2940603 RepID=UPI00216711E6|nr:amidohydrolase family protein [Klebsiella sp. BIGb0407]MCS3431782.1 cytosine/adenosine deaminase-related metal-dependent hydrolase [Klebsiella sp. BIGb0407]